MNSATGPFCTSPFKGVVNLCRPTVRLSSTQSKPVPRSHIHGHTPILTSPMRTSSFISWTRMQRTRNDHWNLFQTASLGLGLYNANEGLVSIQYKCLVPTDVFPEMKLRTVCWASLFSNQNYFVLSPNFHIHVSVSDLYIPRIGLPRNDRGNI
jgi:hypothetical protein